MMYIDMLFTCGSTGGRARACRPPEPRTSAPASSATSLTILLVNSRDLLRKCTAGILMYTDHRARVVGPGLMVRHLLSACARVRRSQLSAEHFLRSHLALPVFARAALAAVGGGSRGVSTSMGSKGSMGSTSITSSRSSIAHLRQSAQASQAQPMPSQTAL